MSAFLARASSGKTQPPMLHDSHGKIAPDPIRKFAEKMHEAGFKECDLQVKLPSCPVYQKLSEDQVAQMRLPARMWYKARSIILPNSLNGASFPEGTYIFNRNTADNPQSNFYVIAKYSKLHGLQVMFTNPLDPDKGGKELKKEEVLINRQWLLSVGVEKWAGEMVELIKEAAKNKPPDKYYAQVHGHWGYSRDKVLMDLAVDDGRSREMNVIMNMLLWHTDFDATGPHNHHYRPLFYDVQKLEAALGMVKVAAMEATLPVHLYSRFAVDRFVRTLNAHREELGIPPEEKIEAPVRINGSYTLSGTLSLLRKYEKLARENGLFVPEPELNGPHTLLWGTEKAMNLLQEHHFSHRTAKFPPLASSVELKPALEFVHRNYNEPQDGIEVRVGAAHPSCDTGWRLNSTMPQIGGLPNVGLLDRVSIGDITLEAAVKLLNERFHGIAAFNPTLPNNEELNFLPWSSERINYEVAYKYNQFRDTELVLASAGAAPYNKLIEECKRKGMDEEKTKAALKSAAEKKAARMARDVETDELERAHQITLAGRYISALLLRTDREIGTGTTPTHNAINLAFSRKMNQEFGLPTFFDADIHLYLAVKPGRKYVGGLGGGRTAISGRTDHTPEAFLHAWDEAREGTKKISAEVFWDNSRGVPKIVAERRQNTLYEQALELLSQVSIYGVHGVPHLAKDVLRSIKTAHPHSLEELNYALMRINR